MDYLALTSTIFYLLATIITGKRLLLLKKTSSKIYFIPIFFALFTHAVWLYQNIYLLSLENLPILNVVSLMTFVLSFLTTVISKRLNTEILQPVVYTFSLLNFLALMYLPSYYATKLSADPYLGSHIILAVLAYSLLSIASLFALQLAYIDHRLKHHKQALYQLKMPPLMTLEKTLFQFVFLGFILLTCTLLTGFMFLNDMFDKGLVGKSILTVIAWFIYAVLLWGRFIQGWRGKAIIYITIIASFILTLAYFGSRIARDFILV
ncbi:MAG: cytochrome c biogenesis protein CcsA [Psychromonas sp.]|nr:cytochrome c biogenesis protein CcsA [Psychromonas sp.]